MNNVSIKPLIIVAVFTIPLLAAAPASANIIVGGPATTNNIYPFGNYSNQQYQQLYGSSDFTAPITITGVQFFNTVFNDPYAQLPTGTFNFYLSTTSVTTTTLSSVYSANIGVNNTLVYSGSISQPWTFGDTLTVNFSSPFTYSPLQGNLLLDITTSVFSLLHPVPFDASNSSAYSRAYTYNGLNYVNIGYGLVTGFTAVPSPPSWLMMLTGLGLLAPLYYRHKRVRMAT